MKVFRKMFAFAVTVSAIAMATSAFAATAEYNEGIVTVKDGSFDETAQMTVAVVPTDFDGDDADIMFIDQDQASVIQSNLVTGLAVKEEMEIPANFEVRVAGTNMDMQTINFETIQGPTYTVVGENLEATTAIGFKGSFVYNGSAKTVVLTLEDSIADKTGTVNWTLLEGINATNTPITFGLEIQSAEAMNMSGISITNIADAPAQ